MQMTYAWTCMKIQSKTIQDKIMEMRCEMADNLEGQETETDEEMPDDSDSSN